MESTLGHGPWFLGCAGHLSSLSLSLQICTRLSPKTERLTGTQEGPRAAALCSAMPCSPMCPAAQHEAMLGPDQGRTRSRALSLSLCVPASGLRGTDLLSGVSLPPAGARQDTQPQGECSAEVCWPHASGRSLGEREAAFAEKEGDRAAGSHRQREGRPATCVQHLPCGGASLWSSETLGMRP